MVAGRTTTCRPIWASYFHMLSSLKGRKIRILSSVRGFWAARQIDICKSARGAWSGMTSPNLCGMIQTSRIDLRGLNGTFGLDWQLLLLCCQAKSRLPTRTVFTNRSRFASTHQAFNAANRDNGQRTMQSGCNSRRLIRNHKSKLQLSLTLAQ